MSLETSGQGVAASQGTLPTGTVTFLFTDIEGSTRLLEDLGPRYESLLADSRRLLREAWAAHHGLEFGAEGDAQFAVFASALDAVRAAVMAQRALLEHDWPEGAQVRVRMGIHTGEAVLAGDDYVGLDLHRAARICNAGHGCQVLLSETARSLVTSTLPDELELRDLGQHRLKDLSRPEHLFQLVGPGMPDRFPLLRTLEVSPNNLPTQLTSFVGRSEQLAALQKLLLATRLLTLTGPGGTGKTRLSLALGADVLSRFPDGVYWVPLAPITDPDLVAPTIAQALSLHEASPRPELERIVDFLAAKQALLLLDNFEQILPAAPVVSELLRATGQARFVITSRAPLHISGEQEYPVPPLPVPDLTTLPTLESLSQSEAVRLFIERAMAVRPDFKLTNENAAAVAEICARLDGLPLAIELAAARIKLLPPAAILSRLGRRLEALGGGARDLPDRQRTLRGAIDWSHELLDDAHRRLFARFGVFIGGATLEAAEAVCGPAEGLGIDVLDGLADLVDHSLVRQSSEAEEPRFQMLETIREYAIERLEASGEAAEIRRRHAMVQRELAESLMGGIFSPQQKAILDRYQREHDDIRAALSWAEEVGDAETALRIGTATWRFWQMRGHLREGRERLERALAQPAPGLDPRIRAQALDALGGILYWESDMAGARQTYLQSLAIYRELRDDRGTAEELYNAAMSVYAYGQDRSLRAAEGKAEAEESRALFQRLGDEGGVMRATWALGSMEMIYVDERASARIHLEEALAAARARDDPFHQGWSLFMLAMIDERQGDLPGMREHLAGALRIFLDADDSSGYNLVLDSFASLAWRQGSKNLAMRLSGFSDALQARTGSRLAALNRAELSYFDPDAERADPILDAEWQAGQGLSLDEAVACALSVPGTPPSEPAAGL